MIRTILAATDFQDRPDGALRSGAALARQLGARLIAVHGTEHGALGAETELRARLADLAIDAEIRIVRNENAGALLDGVRASDADIVVLGPHRHSLLADLFGSSTVEQLIKESRRLILVAGPKVTQRYARVVVAIDLSDGSLAAAEASLHLFPDAHILLVHAFHIPFEGFLRDKRIAADLRAEAEERLSAFCARLSGTPSLEVHIEEGETQSVLMKVVERSGADLLVFGSSSEDGSATRLFGTIATAFLQSPPCDVLAVQAASSRETVL